jgi:hypothetical protein
MLSPILFKLHSEYLTNGVLEGFGDFRREEQVIRAVTYADKLVLLAKKETILLGTIHRIIGKGR